MRGSPRVRMVKGPARVVVRGGCRVLGADVSNSLISVRAGKVLPFEPEPRCRLYARIARRGGTWWSDPHSAGTFIWKEFAGAILAAADQHRGTFLVMLAGDTDTGKSTFGAYLANLVLNKGIMPCVVDGDIGQGDIAPPAAIGAALLRENLTDLRDATANLFEFVGAISPAGLEQFVAGKISSICDRSRNLARMVIVNTDGYVQEDGLRYKRMIADEIRPEIIVCLGESKALPDALSSGSWNVTNVPSSGLAQKSRMERRWRRYNQFLRFVGDGHSRISMSELRFSYLGKIYSPADLALVPLFAHASLENMFVGLGSGGRVIGFGVITGSKNGSIELRTDTTDFDTISLSNIRLAGGNAEQISPEMQGRVCQEN